MNRHKIAGLNVDMGYKYERMLNQANAYTDNFTGEPDVKIYITDEEIEKSVRENKGLDNDSCEYMWTGALFYESLVDFNGFVLHASAVVMDGKAYLFSAPSGTGKSTHTALWCEHFGKKAEILNDDKPAIRVVDNAVKVYGTPWSGKTALNLNREAELAGICFLQRADTNYINRLSAESAIIRILEQTIRPQTEEGMSKLLETLDKVITKVNVYNMGCTISVEAAKLAYERMYSDYIEKNK